MPMESYLMNFKGPLNYALLIQEGYLHLRYYTSILKIQSDNSRLDILGFYYINGKILNGGPLTATDSSAIATLYDKDGKVIAIGRALAEPVNIGPDSQAAFGVAVTEKSQTYKIKSYSLIADSNQYVSLPILLFK